MDQTRGGALNTTNVSGHSGRETEETIRTSICKVGMCQIHLTQCRDSLSPTPEKVLI